MEGVGSRLGRASSRYGPAATVFNGPVRKWKKKWVHVSSSATVSYQNPQSQSKGQNNHTNGGGGSHLLLCRWTPIPPSTASADGVDVSAELASGGVDEPPRRKFRYTPIAVLEGQKKQAEKKVEDEVKTGEVDQSLAGPTTMSGEMHEIEKPDINDVLNEEAEASVNESPASTTSKNLDLDLGLKGLESFEAGSEMMETQMQKGSSSGFWSIG